MNERIETMRLMLQEGSELLGRMNERVDALKSKNMDFMTTILAIAALIAGALFFAVEQDWLPSIHLLWSLLFFAPVLWSLYLCYTLFKPRTYPELSTYDDPNLTIVINASLEEALSSLIYRKREVLQELERRYSVDLTTHRGSVGWFAASLFGLVLFLAIELLNM
jgi:hypothetical protein